MNHANIVHKIYRDFAAGDGAAILAVLADDIEFRLAENHPYRGTSGAWHGKQAVAERFFAVAAGDWDRWAVRVDALVETPDTVVVEGRYTGTCKSTGRALDVEVCHLWRFRRNVVASFHQYVDTARLRHVMGAKTTFV